MQEGMLFHNMLDPESDAYFQQNIVTISEKLDHDLLYRSLQLLVERFDIFRTVFVYKNEERPLQVVLSEQEAQFYYEDLSNQTNVEKEERFRSFMLNDRKQHFDLETDGLIRLSVFEMEKEEFKLVWSFPHIIMDGWCLSIIAKDFFNIYNGLKESRSVYLEPVFPYSSYIQWLGEQSKVEALDYWRRYIGDVELETTLPGRKFGDFNKGNPEFMQETLHFDESLTQDMTRLSQKYQVTLSTVFQAIWGLLLQVYNQSKVVVFGSVVSGRPNEVTGIEEMVGLFINTIPVKVSLEAGDTFGVILKRMQSEFMDSNRYAYLSLAEIQAISQLKQQLVQHIVVFENYPISEEIMGNDNEGNSKLVNITGFEGFEQTNFDFDVLVAPGRTLEVSFRYNAARFESGMIRRLSAHLIKLTQQIVTDPEIAIDQYDIVTDEERRQIIQLFNNTSAAYPMQTTIVEQFESMVTNSPEKTAVIFGNKQLTYSELNGRVNQVARKLQNHGVIPDQIVGIMVERSCEMAIALLAVLKAGGAYLPIDPMLPEERIRYMLKDSNVKVILTQRRFEEMHRHFLKTDESDAANTYRLKDVMTIIVDEEDLYQGDASNPCLAIMPGNLAYIIYTSGTTGKPKGVMIEHRSLVNRLHWMQKQYPINDSDVILQKTPYTFDVSVWEQFWWAIQGSEVVFLEPGDEKDPHQIVKAIARNKVTTIHFVPSMLSAFLDYVESGGGMVLSELSSLRQVFASGEALTPKQVNRFNALLFRGGITKLINLYGPTEATIDVSYFDCFSEQPFEQIPIGKPIDNTELYILSTGGRLQPIGVPGELCIAGMQLARGYLNLPELTAEKFVPIPFRTEERMYRTGDLARWLPDGNIEYLGRIDHQVKIRGYRIELGEIERVLQKHPAVKEAIVVKYEDSHLESYLCAYVVTKRITEVQSYEFRDWLGQELPQYMIPLHYVTLEQMPLSSNGKINIKSLQLPLEAMFNEKEYVAPRNIIEVQLVRIWKEVLGRAEIGIEDNFFEMGGHSLLATTLVAKIHKEMNFSLSLREVFQFPTVEQLSDMIYAMERRDFKSIPRTEEREHYPVSSSQKRLFALSQIEGGELTYNMPGAMMLEGSLDSGRLEKAFCQLIARHEILRTGFEMVDGELMQRVHLSVEFQMGRVALQGKVEETIGHFVRVFDLQKPPLLRAVLIDVEQDRHILLFDMHHIISDGASIDILVKELVLLYGAEDLSPLQIQFKDYAVWQQKNVQSEQKVEQEHYWLDTFRGELPRLEMPTDFPRAVDHRFEGDTLEFIINIHRSNGVRQLAAETGSTMYMVLLAAYTILLHKYTEQEDLIIGTPVSGRQHSELENLIGMFVNTLALRVYPTGDKSVRNYVLELKDHILGAQENQNYPFEELVEKLNVRRESGRHPLFDTMFVLENKEDRELDMEGINLKPYPLDYSVSKYDIIFQAVEQGNELICSFNFATSLYKRETIERMVEHLLHLIDAMVVDPQTKLSSVELITIEEKAQILDVFNNTSMEYPSETTVHKLFETQAKCTPEQIAIVHEDRYLTYQELNEQANRLARTLKAEGVRAGKRVAIMVERSPEMLVGILAVLKTGGAYVPVDPDYPQERKRYMLLDSGANVLLLQNRWRENFEYDGKILEFEDPAIYSEDSTNLDLNSKGDDLVYVIYTSGTTGKPKGVMVEHRSLVNLCCWHQRVFEIDCNDHSTLFAGVGFDASAWEIFPYLLVGATIYVVDKESRLDPRKLNEFMNTNQINICFLPSQICELFMEFENEYLRIILTGGDKLQRYNRNNYQLYNNYGPTENTVVTTYLRVDRYMDNIPIGMPIDNCRVYILNSHHQLQPVGVAGEVYISGAGLARGYLNQAELTSEKFLQDPFVPGERMYRTGDLAKWLPDGSISYLGRTDNQVKVRGFRIELGEIEVQLLNMESVKEAVVIPTEDESGQKLLWAYFVADKSLKVTELNNELAKLLPSYMIPSHFVQVERIPLTSNGKVDHKALSALEGDFSTGMEYVPPQSFVEKLLVSAWQDVLGITSVGIMDDFFELGGDSIKSIGVSSRLYQAGYKLEIKYMFKYSTISELCPHVKPIVRIADQGEVKGEIGLTPIQHWFFEQEFDNQHHFNQSIMLFREQGFEESAIRKALYKLAEHHDALRMLIRRNENGYEAWNRGINEGEVISLEVMNFIGTPDFIANAVELKSNEIQSSISLEDGALIKAGLFHCEDGDHLLLVFHHLVVDGISWRILLEDLASGYEQALLGDEIKLPEKTDSFQLWTEQLSSFARNSGFKEESEFWRSICNVDVQPLPKDMEYNHSLIRDMEMISVQWTREETDQLLKQAHFAYNTDMNDLLLCALVSSISEWGCVNQVLLNLEGHGRETIVSDINITRTVGWFTSLYPVVLGIESGTEIPFRIKSVKEKLRQIPNKGIGYGILKYLSRELDDTSLAINPEVSFNYLGQFDRDLDKNDLQLSPYSSGESLSESIASSYVLEINGRVIGGFLEFSISYSGKQYRKETIEGLANLFHKSLQDIISHCTAKQLTEPTPSDFMIKGMTLDELEQLTKKMDPIGRIEDIYPLTPMQKGMLFHSQIDPDSSAYFEQMTYKVKGVFDPEAFKESLEILTQRHDALRTNFHVGWREEAIQVVFKDRSPIFTYLDLRDIPENQREDCVKKMQQEDKVRGFDLSKDALMRMTVLRTSESTYRFLWSFHHILMDGWCLFVIAKEVFSTYYAISNKLKLDLTKEWSYRQFFEWLKRQDVKAAADYWRNYLSNYEQQTLLPQAKTRGKTKEYVVGKLVYTLSQEFTGLLKKTAKRQQVTMNTLIQTAWGILLQRYNGTADVVFGNVVSGRPTDISGIETAIGLFINTVPVRIRYQTDNPTVAEVMRKTQEQALEAQPYDTYPLYEIQALSDLKQNLLNHIMVFENYPVDKQVEEVGNDGQTGFQITDVEIVEQTNYDFNLIIGSDKELVIQLVYNACVYDKDGMEQVQNHLVHLLEQIVDNPKMSVNDLELITPEEKTRILEQFNSPTTDLAWNNTIHQLFEAQVERTPDQVAVVFEDKRLTYRELNMRANQLARTLQSEGVKADQLVGIMANRSIEMIVGILGILKSGGAYVPIDPEYPQERIGYILEDSGVKVMILQHHLLERVSFSGTIVDLDDVQIYHKDVSNLISIVGAHHLAYVIYTSGTTGKPKGVMVEHRGLCNLKPYFEGTLKISGNDKIAQFASLSFDAASWEIFMSLFCGAALFIPSTSVLLDYELFEGFISGNEITVVTLPPTYANNLNPKRLLSLKKMVVAGSASSIELVRKWKDEVTYLNAYGPTEDSICSSVWPASTDFTGDGLIPIGHPIPNHQMFILDREGHLLPTGITGELCISGVGLARGYLNRSELTAEKFVSNPFIEGERMYRTGDLAKWLGDGKIEYVGRIDDQVKIRGYRIELGEVETQLLKVDSVQEAVVVAREDEGGHKYLCTYFVTDKPLTFTQLKVSLAQTLPEYMIPSLFIQLEQMPLTTNGKIDRRALPKPEGRIQIGSEYLAPQSTLELHLVQLWEEVLGLSNIGVNDNFFEIGGHSLNASLLLSRINKFFQVALPLRTLFEAPVLRLQAEIIKNAESFKFEALEPVEKRQYYPVTSAQNRILVAQNLDIEKTTYNVPLVLEINDSINMELLENSFLQLIERHEAFRTSFELRNGQYVQRIHDQVPFNFVKTQVVAGSGSNGDITILESHIKKFIQPFDLNQAPLIRAELVSINQNSNYLMIDLHHVIADGLSMEIITEEFYAICKGGSLSEPNNSYKDYSVWLDRLKVNGAMERHERFWLQTFDGELPVLSLSTDFPRPLIQNHEGSIVSLTVTEEGLLENINQIAAETGTTMFMVLLACYEILMHRYTGQDDLIVGTPVAGRSHVDIQRTVGMFVNTLAVRSKPNGSKNFMQVLLELKEYMLKALEHQMYPFEELVDKLRLQRDISRHPLFDTLFTIRNSVNRNSEPEENPFTVYEYESRTSKFDLSFFGQVDGQSLQLDIEYATTLFRKQTVEHMLQHYITILKAVIANTLDPIERIDILSDKENEQILKEFNQTRADYAREDTIHGSFKKQAERMPDQVAIVDGEKTWTYHELNEQANCMAQQLIKIGLKSQEPVGLMAGRSADTIIAMLGILKAGGAYLPIDPSYPDERVNFMMKDAGINILMTENMERMVSLDYSGIVLCLNDIPPVTGMISLPPVSAKDLSYIMYTSGSTGRPKGVMVLHKNVNRLVQNVNYVIFGKEDRMLLTGNIVFDACTFEIWGALLNGLQLHIISEKTILDSCLLDEAIRRKKITTMWLTTPLFHQHAQYKPNMFESLKQLLVGGDVLNPSHVRNVQQHCPGLKIINAYGPTENTTFSAYFLIEGDYANIPIGRPIANSTLYIVDKQLNLQPVGVPGEIVVGGDGVAAGYLNNEKLTGEKFVSNPFEVGEKLYLTGDMGRWLPDGTVEYLGRMDNQVKIRGFRIEIGEIEKRLLEHEAINGAIVIAVDNEEQQKYLCAYVVSNHDLKPLNLKNYLASVLPEYMIPSRYIMLARMPLTQSGKIDRRALPQPQLVSYVQQEYEAPRNEAERKLVEIWQRVLEVERVGISDNFFELGGHSLKAVQIVSEARENGILFNLNQIFLEQTISGLARSLGPVMELKSALLSINNMLFNFDEAEKLLSNYLGVPCRLVVEEQAVTQAILRNHIVLNISDLYLSDEEQAQLVQFLKLHLDPSLHPHYIRTLNEAAEVASTLELGEIDAKAPSNEKSYIIAEILEDAAMAQLNYMYDSILSEPVIGEMPLSGTQYYHLKHPDISGTFIELDRYVQFDLMAEAVRILIHRHELLRCTITGSDMAPTWEIRQAPSTFKLPVLDCSMYPSVMMEDVMLSLMSGFFYKPYDMQAGHPLYRVLLVRRNLREHLLLFPFAHIIFDYMSSEWLSKELIQIYELLETGTEMPATNVRSYSEYIAQLRRGPQEINEAELIDQFSLSPFENKSSVITETLVRRREGKYTKFMWVIDAKPSEGQTTPGDMWELAFSKVIAFCCKYFDVERVPIWITHFGRQYEQSTFYDIIGEFIDQIPLLADGASTPIYLAAETKMRIDQAVRHNINFMSLIYDEKLAADYPESSRLLKSSLEGMPIVFNYVGEGSVVNEGNMMRPIESGETKIEDHAIVFTARSLAKQLHLSLVLPYEEQYDKIASIMGLNIQLASQSIGFEEIN